MQPGYDYFGSTLDISFNVAYYLKLCIATSIYCISRIYQQMLNWLFGHLRTITTLLVKKLHQQ